MKSVKKLALYGVLIALAIVLGYVEMLVPNFFFVPGMKLGLTNVVVVTALYTMDVKSAVIINFVRILLCALLFGNGVSLIYSLAGGLLSTAVMILLKQTGHFSIPMVSVAGGVMHNVGQILVAMVLMDTLAIGWYLMILWFSGMLTGALIGLLASLVAGRVRKLAERQKTDENM